MAELYPALAYAVALRPELPARRLRVAKTRCAQRDAALRRLGEASWVAKHSVMISDRDLALESEDDFDALLSAAALLRCVLDGVPLDEPDHDDPVAEGGILLTAAVDFSTISQNLVVSPRAGDTHPLVPSAQAELSRGTPTAMRPADGSGGGARSPPAGHLLCPIPGCGKAFRRGRLGWDAHVASSRNHLSWHPEVRDPAARKELFKRIFPDWFGRRRRR
jgi:hypothetical protein